MAGSSEEGERQDVPVEVNANLSLHFFREIPHDVMHADATVDGPRRLEVLLHARLERFRYASRAKEVLEVARLHVVVETTRVHSLDDGCDVAEHDSVHESCNNKRKLRQFRPNSEHFIP